MKDNFILIRDLLLIDEWITPLSIYVLSLSSDFRLTDQVFLCRKERSDEWFLVTFLTEHREDLICGIDYRLTPVVLRRT